MGRAGRAGACALLALAACGGGGGDDQVAGDVDVAGQPVAAVDPCGLLPAAEASRLSGGAVEVDDDAARSSLGAAIGCTYRFAEGDGVGGDLGGALAASLVLVEPELPPVQTLETVAAEATVDDADVTDVAVGDAAATIVTETEVQVVTVIETVLVFVTVVPADGEVDEALVDEVVAFAESTVEPVKEALEAEAPAEEGTTTTAESAADDGPATGGDQEIRVGELEGLWTGDWGTMALRVEGEQVLGAYTHDDGRIVGTFDDGVFIGRWSEVPSRAEPNDAGDVEFRFTKTSAGLTLDGRWRYGSEGEFREDWDLVLSDEEIPEELVAAFEDESTFVEVS